MKKIKAFFEKIILSNPVLEFICYFFAAVVCVGFLVWFFVFSGYGAPPEFVYNQF